MFNESLKALHLIEQVERKLRPIQNAVAIGIIADIKTAPAVRVLQEINNYGNHRMMLVMLGETLVNDIHNYINAVK